MKRLAAPAEAAGRRGLGIDRVRSVSGCKHGHDQICSVPDRDDGQKMGGHQAAEKQSDFHWRAPVSVFPDTSTPVGPRPARVEFLIVIS